MELHARLSAVTLARAVGGVLALVACAGCASGAGRPRGPAVQYAKPEDERLVDPVARPTPVPVPTPAAAPDTLTAVEVLAVSVQPPRVARGSEARLVVHYRLGGAPSSAALTVTEVRMLVRGSETIQTLSDPLERGPGRAYTSMRPVTVPATAAPGLYSLQARVVAGASAAEGAAVFEVY